MIGGFNASKTWRWLDFDGRSFKDDGDLVQSLAGVDDRRVSIWLLRRYLAGLNSGRDFQVSASAGPRLSK